MLLQKIACFAHVAFPIDLGLRVAWDESIAFPLGPRVKKSYMSHTQAYPRQLYGKEEEWNICQVRPSLSRRKARNSELATFFASERIGARDLSLSWV